MEHQISLTDAAKVAARELKSQGRYLRLQAFRRGCCSISIEVFPDVRHQGDLEETLEDITILISPVADGVIWRGYIDYKPKGFRKGFHWKST